MLRLILLPVVLLVITPACKQKRKSPHETVKGNGVSVTYGRPFKNGRDIFGGLEKYGQVWRTGADEATVITFDNDVLFAGKPVKAGSYTLFTIPNETEWTIILNGELGQWGAYDYSKYKNKDVLQVNIPVHHPDAVVEQHTIRFTPDNKMIIEWDKTQVQIPIQTDDHQTLNSHIPN